jgi:glycosyltransferase involved in cell wall biosynthesis
VKVLLVGVSVEQRFVPTLNAVSKPHASISIAAIKFTRLIVEGFRHHLGDGCTAVLLVPVGMYPASRILRWKSRTVDGCHYLPFINVLILKQLSIAISLGWFALRWSLANPGQRRVVVFTCIYLPFLAPFLLLKRAARLKLVSFVPDLPEFEFDYERTRLSIKRTLIPLYVRLTTTVCRIVDHFVFLTEAMKSKFTGRSYTVIEGFVDAHPSTLAASPATTGPRSLMYAGALLEKFGIRTLLDAFRSLNGNYELWLFGSGEMQADAVRAAAKDPRIKVFGNVPNRDVLAYERRATVLVNPRPTSNAFTRYSFPSKILEYMASGRPVLTTRLAGIPSDYDDKLWFIDDESVDGMRNALEQCLARPDAELTAMGRRAAGYVQAEKNNVTRVGQLLRTLEAL